jgi:four helix bundle protein
VPARCAGCIALAGDTSGRVGEWASGRRGDWELSMSRIAGFRQLRVYRGAMSAAMDIYRVSKSFPSDERYSLTDQVRRSSRGVCACIAEAWRKRAYPRHFVSKITDAESEAEETRVWLEFAFRCGYIPEADARRLDQAYDHALAQLVSMKTDPKNWAV